MGYAGNESPDQTAHVRSLIMAFVAEYRVIEYNRICR